LRAGLIKDLKELDKYPWTGHSAIMGKKKNPFVSKQQANNFPFAGRRITFSQFRPETEKVTINPENPACPVGAKHRTGVKNKPLAEKTIEEVLLQFGDKLREARRKYRHFVKQGVDQGSRPELQGGGLLRSAGGDKRTLLGRKKEERELYDERILGGGDFVSAILQQSEKFLERKYRSKKTIDDLIMVVASKVGVSPELICSRSRQKKPSEARAIFSYLAVEETGYPAADVARFLGIKRMSVHEAVTKGKTLCTEYALLGQKRE